MGDPPVKPKDAYHAIVADLERGQKARRAHFLPAIMLVAIVVLGFFVVMRVRPDLLDQPPEQLAVQCVMWVLCLLLMPAIGVGLFFPNRRLRLAIAVAAVFCAMAATTGWPFGAPDMHGPDGGLDRCAAVVVGTGVLMLGIGMLSGAFVQRRRITGVFWVVAGLSLAALNIVTWHCPQSGLMHVLPSHLGGAGLLLAVGAAIGVMGWRRERGDAKDEAESASASASAPGMKADLGGEDPAADRGEDIDGLLGDSEDDASDDDR